MISKLCSFVPRTEFIVKIFDLIAENPKSQIMPLSHQRAMLTKIFDMIHLRNSESPEPLTTVGYVGGMKQECLKDRDQTNRVGDVQHGGGGTRHKNIHALVTPKTDIVQAVGRILRAKHDAPIIVDLVDKHDVFKTSS
jgi:hypothetical protein